MRTMGAPRRTGPRPNPPRPGLPCMPAMPSAPRAAFRRSRRRVRLPGTSSRRSGWLPTVCCAVLLLPSLAAAEERRMDGGTAGRDTSPAWAVLDLPREGTLAGRLLDGRGPDGGTEAEIVWQAPGFQRPFVLPLERIVGIRFPMPADRPESGAEGGWVVELVDGDQIVGDLLSIDDRRVEVAFGPQRSPLPVSIARTAVKSVFRRGSAADPDIDRSVDPRAATWRPSPADTWREVAGRWTNTTSDAAVFRDFPADEAARYDLAISWQQRPTIRIAFDADAADASAEGYRVELLPDGIVAVREERAAGGEQGGRADVQPCGDLPATGVHLTVFIDRRVGRLVVMLPRDAMPVADLTIPPAARKAGRGVRVTVVAGSVAIDAVRASPWRGGAVVDDDLRRGAIRLDDGGTVPAIVATLAEGAAAVTVQPVPGRAATVRQLPLADIEQMIFPFPKSDDDDQHAAAGRRIRVADRTGSRLTGQLQQVERGTVYVRHPAIAVAVPLPIETLATLAGVGEPLVADPPGRGGRFEGPHASHWGCLVNDGPAGAARGIAWQPLGSLTASPPTAAAEPEAPPVTIRYAGADGAEAVAPQGAMLFLRSGETVPCRRVEEIDAAGVRLEVQGGEAATVPGGLVKAIELVPTASRPLAAEKFRSLTTLPRTQRVQPPTHVVRSVTGDYLRGRRLEMTADTVRITLDAAPNGTAIEIPRGDVARLIWLHPEPPAAWEPPPLGAGDGLPVAGIARDGARVRILATHLDGDAVVGTHPVVGSYRIDLSSIQRLSLGAAEPAAAASLPYAQWRLSPVSEPARRGP